MVPYKQDNNKLDNKRKRNTTQWSRDFNLALSPAFGTSSSSSSFLVDAEGVSVGPTVLRICVVDGVVVATSTMGDGALVTTVGVGVGEGVGKYVNIRYGSGINCAYGGMDGAKVLVVLGTALVVPSALVGAAVGAADGVGGFGT